MVCWLQYLGIVLPSKLENQDEIVIYASKYFLKVCNSSGKPYVFVIRCEGLHLSWIWAEVIRLRFKNVNFL